jgi:hypothetical protein
MVEAIKDPSSVTTTRLQGEAVPQHAHDAGMLPHLGNRHRRPGVGAGHVRRAVRFQSVLVLQQASPFRERNCLSYSQLPASGHIGSRLPGAEDHLFEGRGSHMLGTILVMVLIVAAFCAIIIATDEIVLRRSASPSSNDTGIPDS